MIADPINLHAEAPIDYVDIPIRPETGKAKQVTRPGSATSYKGGVAGKGGIIKIHDFSYLILAVIVHAMGLLENLIIVRNSTSIIITYNSFKLFGDYVCQGLNS